MARELSCPSCHAKGFDLCSYESMMVLHPNLALFTLPCPSCGTKVSAIHPIPPALRDEVAFAAIEVHAKMGRE